HRTLQDRIARAERLGERAARRERPAFRGLAGQTVHRTADRADEAAERAISPRERRGETDRLPRGNAVGIGPAEPFDDPVEPFLTARDAPRELGNGPAPRPFEHAGGTRSP